MHKFVTTVPNDRSLYMAENQFVEEITPDSLIENFQLKTWEAQMAPNHDIHGNPIHNSNYVYHNALVSGDKRNGNILNTHVGDRYNIVQFETGVKWFEYFVSEGLLTIQSALIVDDHHIGVTCDLGLDDTVQGEDTVERYFILGLSHAPGFPRILGFTDIRPICQNTLHAASVKALGKVGAAFSLDANPEKAMREARACIDFQNRRFHEVEMPAYRELTKLPINDESRESLFRKLLGLPLEGWDFSETLLGKYEALEAAYKSSPGMELFDSKEHTGWRVLQAVTYVAGQGENGLSRFKSRYGSPAVKNTHDWLADRLPKSAIKVGSKFSLV